MAGRFFSLAVAGGLAGLLQTAWAQEPRIEPSPALKCLTPPPGERGAPEYPFDQWKRSEEGRVKVALDFTGATVRPGVEVLEHEGDSEFIDAVKDHVRSFRVPCLTAADTPTRLVFDYVFKPDLRQALFPAPFDTADKGRAAQLKCLVHKSREKGPEYPREALRRDLQGRVLLYLRFTSPDQPPESAAYTAPGNELLKRDIEQWAGDYRLPCHQGGPITASIIFVYTIGDTGAYGFKDITFVQYLGRVKNIRVQTLQLDTHTMGCPFDVKLTYRKPHLNNVVGQLDNGHPARRPLLDWLVQAELDLPRQSLASVFADDVRFTVPCIKINLKPKEKT